MQSKGEQEAVFSKAGSQHGPGVLVRLGQGLPQQERSARGLRGQNTHCPPGPKKTERRNAELWPQPSQNNPSESSGVLDV